MVVTPIGGGQFQVGWTNQAVYDSIQVWHYPPIGPSNLEATLAGTAATYTIPLAENGDYFNVRGVVNGVYSLFAGGRPCIGPTPPVATAATNLANTSFSANWNASPNGSGYLVDVSTDPAFGSFVPGYQNKIVGNVLTVAVTGLTAGTTYYYRVKATSGTGQSGYSNVITVTTTGSVAFSFTPTTAIINWTDSGGPQSGDLAFFNAHKNIATITTILFGGGSAPHQVVSVIGLASLPSLSSFFASSNALTSPDFTGCSSLTTLDVSANPLTSIIVTGCAALTTLICNSDSLSVLDVSSCVSLTTLDCSDNSLSALDISNCVVLNNLNCGNNTIAAATSQGINAILVSLLAHGNTGGTAVLNVQTPPAPPSGSGAAAKIALGLETPPWTVTTD